jgi:hypothetical protein
MKHDPITDEFIELSIFMTVAVLAVALFVFTPLGDLTFNAVYRMIQYVFGAS